MAPSLYKNLHEPPIHVLHSGLERDSNQSEYRVICPKCTIGLLLVGRDMDSFKLLRVDRCTHCGQIVIYDDETIAGQELLPFAMYEAVERPPPRPTVWSVILEPDED